MNGEEGGQEEQAERRLEEAERVRREEAQRQAQVARQRVAPHFAQLVEASPHGRRLAELFEEVMRATVRGDRAEIARFQRQFQELRAEANATETQATQFLQENSTEQKHEQTIEFLMPEAVATAFSAFKPIMEEKAKMTQAIIPILVDSSFEAVVEGPINNIMEFWRNEPIVNQRSLREFCEEHADRPVAFFLFLAASREEKDRPPPTFSLVKRIFHRTLSKMDAARLSTEGTVHFPIGACTKEACKGGHYENNPECQRLLARLLFQQLLLTIATSNHNHWVADFDEDNWEKSCLVYTPGLLQAGGGPPPPKRRRKSDE